MSAAAVPPGSAGRAEPAVVRVETDPAYLVRVGPGELGSVAEVVDTLGATRVAVLTDGNVAPHWAPRLGRLASAPLLAVEPGERSKRFPVLERVLEFLVAADLDRGSALVALGGGVVGDLGGLAASLYMRGIPVVQCPTSLLAMVDSSVGGKTAVDLEGGKNLAGTFHQPSAVLADTDTLGTLPEVELRSGLGEVVKTAVIGDPELLDLLEREAPAVLRRDPDLLGAVVARCVRAKAAVVAADEREGGLRKVLNLGHTFGHAIELAAGYGTVPHGIAVAAGLGLAARAAERSGVLADPELPARLEAVARALGLPSGLAEVRAAAGRPLPAEELLAGLRHDKKGRAGVPSFVLPRRAGDVAWDQELDPDLLARLLA